MSDMEEFNAQEWDRLIDFAYPCDEHLTPQEVQEGLKQLGVDSAPAFNQVKLLLEAANARAGLASARQRRPGVTAWLSQAKAKLDSSIKPSIEEVRQFLREHLTGDAAGAYARKLERADEDDLRSIIEDLTHLESLNEANDDGQSEQ